MVPFPATLYKTQDSPIPQSSWGAPIGASLKATANGASLINILALVGHFTSESAWQWLYRWSVTDLSPYQRTISCLQSPSSLMVTSIGVLKVLTLTFNYNPQLYLLGSSSMSFDNNDLTLDSMSLTLLGMTWHLQNQACKLNKVDNINLKKKLWNKLCLTILLDCYRMRYISNWCKWL